MVAGEETMSTAAAVPLSVLDTYMEKN